MIKSFCKVLKTLWLYKTEKLATNEHEKKKSKHRNVSVDEECFVSFSCSFVAQFSCAVLLRSHLRGDSADVVFVEQMAQRADAHSEQFGGFGLIAAGATERFENVGFFELVEMNG